MWGRVLAREKVLTPKLRVFFFLSGTPCSHGGRWGLKRLAFLILELKRLAFLCVSLLLLPAGETQVNDLE